MPLGPFDFRGMDLTSPSNRQAPGRVSIAQNCRAYQRGGVNLRNLLTDPLNLNTTTSSSSNTPDLITQSGSGQAWVNPGAILDPPGSSYASITLGGSFATSSQVLSASSFALVVPVGAAITGIQFTLQSLPSVGNPVTVTFQTQSASVGVGTTVTRSLGGSSGASVVIGGPGQLFGYAWTPALINASGFGLLVSAAGGSSSSLASAYLYLLQATVFYSAGVPLVLGAAPHTLRRLNDSTNPTALPSGYVLVIGAAGVMYVNLAEVASGFSGNPVSLIPFRPNTSVQPWMYIGDSAPEGSVTLYTKYLINGNPVNFVTNSMAKVRSDGLIYKMGIEEPQLAPVVSTAPSNVTTGGTLKATAIPWTNYTGQNSGYNYGESNGYPKPSPDGTAPFVVDVANASFITITSLTGTATVNGGSHAPSDSSSTWVTPGSPSYPGQFIQITGTGLTPSSASVVVGAFTDGAGNVIAKGVAPLYIPSVVDVGAVIGVSQAIQVPYGAKVFQIGINSVGNTYSANSGSYAISVTVTTDALPPVTGIIGDLTAYYFGDSPTSGPTGSYIWKNPDDPGGSGPTRSTSNADGSTTGNSFIFDATFTSGIPALPGVGSPTLPMEWTTLSPESVAIGTNPVFAAPITSTYPTNTQFANFNFCLTGNIYFPSAGNYTFVLTNHDDVIWGIGGGVTLVSATTSGSGEGGVAQISDYGQTITVVGGYPLLPKEKYTNGEGGKYAQCTVVVSVPAAGIYPIELDFDYWYHSGRILLLQASAMAGGSPTIIPPLAQNIRREVQYRYVYRSSATGATSNPSPESTAESVPVTANTITSIWSPDPQVDVVDYYRLDAVTANFTYVNTGPNDDLGGGGTNTPVSDSLLDTELGTQLLNYDNYEPFPSIDLPQKGICNVSGGVITWVSGGAIGGTQTGFNIRWLAGTEILIGSPTSLAYTFIARPTSTTSVTIPGVPDGDNLAYEIEQPILAAQPLAYIWGPTDNINYAFGVGDPLRPGTLYWCQGSNLDAAPDTNQQDLTDPGEPLVNGAISSGLGVVFSIKRAWLILPNFFNALATVTGVEGSTWSLQESSITRGLYIPRCVCVSGGGNIFFRVDDGIHISPRGAMSKSITDDSLYPLFAHENEDESGSQPVSVTREGVTIVPPDDTFPELQRFSYQNGFMYYDYQGIDGYPHTLVFDEAAMGWVWDAYATPATIHAANEGTSQQGVLVGCSDGSIRQLSSAGTETATAILLSAAIGGKGFAHWGEAVVEYSSTSTITLICYAADEGNGSYGPPTITLPNTSGQMTKYFFRPGANKWKLLWAQFISTKPFQLNFSGTVFYCRSWGSTAEYQPVQIFGSAGGEG